MSTLKNLPKRGFFNYSKAEYKTNAQLSLASAKPKYKELKLVRTDNSICTVNLYGYPIQPLFDRHPTEDNPEQSDFIQHLKDKRPQYIIC